MKQYKIEKENDKLRLDKVLSYLDEELSRARIQKLIQEGKVLVNGKVQRASYKVSKGEIIELKPDRPKEIDLKAQDIPLDVLYEDEDIIVVNKEKGMVVHPAAGNLDGTLVNALMARCKDSLSGIGGEIRPGIVHRLDKNTSGILVVAKNDAAHQALTEQLKEHKMKKTYLALVRGVISENEATINMPIARSKVDRKKMAVDKDGKEAITHFKVLKRYEKYTYLEVNIETGRTHQIRVHLSNIGHPIIGDDVYSNGKNEFGIQGQMLHAYCLEFMHPITKKDMKIEAKLPQYFEEILQNLNENK